MGLAAMSSVYSLARADTGFYRQQINSGCIEQRVVIIMNSQLLHPIRGNMHYAEGGRYLFGFYVRFRKTGPVSPFSSQRSKRFLLEGIEAFAVMKTWVVRALLFTDDETDRPYRRGIRGSTCARLGIAHAAWLI